VNVSASEGIPVSIMEAMSAYTPVIATDVDGNGEIVQDQYNGFLLSPDFTNEHLAALIEKCANTNLQPLRQNAYNTWNEKFNAHKNYSNFVKEILSL
jgi:glycosyltransferase involved in cell wall biosynthesis